MSTELAYLGSKQDQLPAHLADLPPESKGLGNENVGAGDQQVPRIALLQALSPQLEEIEGAKAGMFHNSVTNELYTSVTAINLAYKKEFSIWRKRNKGGGFCGSFDDQESAQAQVEGLPGTAADYDIQETAKHACLLLDPATGEPRMPVIIYFKSTGLNASRNWNTQINTFNGDMPRFSSIWTLTSTKQSNDQGTWYTWKVNEGGWVPSEALYKEAQTFYEAMRNHF